MAHDKNEGIFLWMLEQDRQKSRLRVIEDMNRNSAVPSGSISESFPDLFEEIGEDGELESADVETSDLERLLKEKEVLEEESRRLDEEQKRLSLLERVVLERLVREKEKKNDEKKQVITRLQQRVRGLEDELERLSVSQDLGEITAEKIGGEDGMDATPVDIVG